MSKHKWRYDKWMQHHYCDRCGVMLTEHEKQKRCNHKAGNHEDGTQKVGHNKSWIRRLNWRWRQKQAPRIN